MSVALSPLEEGLALFGTLPRFRDGVLAVTVAAAGPGLGQLFDPGQLCVTRKFALQPGAFVAFVDAHQAGHVTVPEGVAGRDWRRRLAYRTTDEVVRAELKMIPLSVAADRIGHTAMRCAGLLARLAERGRRGGRVLAYGAGPR